MSPLEPIEDLKIMSDPVGADVYLNGKLKGKTPLLLGDLKSGTHRLKLEKKGYHTIVRDIRLPHKTQKVNIILRAKDKSDEAFTSYG